MDLLPTLPIPGVDLPIGSSDPAIVLIAPCVHLVRLSNVDRQMTLASRNASHEILVGARSPGVRMQSDSITFYPEKYRF